jgi:hypothetical protein
MSSISSVTSATTNPYQVASQNGFGQIAQDFQAIGSALQSGDLSTAQNSLTTFQQALQGASPTSANQPFGKNSQANTDYQSLTSALQTGDLAGAQKAFTSLKTDLKASQSAQAVHKGHHHHHAASATEATAATNASSTPASGAAESVFLGVSGGPSLNVTA